MILDVNILLAYVNADDPLHMRISRWLDKALNGSVRVGFPLHSLLGFWRIATNPRAVSPALTTDEAAEQIDAWLASQAAWVPQPGQGHLAVVRQLLTEADRGGPLVPDAHLAALAIEHGVSLLSADHDFQRFGTLVSLAPLP